MNSKKRRSSLRKSIALDIGATDIKAQLKRRISFSGKNLVRVFHDEEEPKTWNNSYEISDHLNVDENTQDLCTSAKTKKIKSQENKENVTSTNSPRLEEFKCSSLTKNEKDVSSTNNTSALSTTKDMINVSYKNSKLYQIENSVDITLHERELKFRVDKDKDHRSATNECSFSLDGTEKGGQSSVLSERTIDFMQDLQKNYPNVDEYENVIVEDNKNPEVSTCADYINKNSCLELSCDTVKNAKEVIAIYTKDDLIRSTKMKCLAEDQKIDNKSETIRQTMVKLISPHKAMQYDKENINPVRISNVNDTIPNANVTLTNICEMDIEDSQSLCYDSNVNVNKESREFGNKLDSISFLQDLDSGDYIKEEMNSEKPKIAANKKYRPTIIFNQPIVMSPKCYDVEKTKVNSRTSICTSTQSMDLLPKKIVEHEDVFAHKLKSDQISSLYDNEHKNSKENDNRLQDMKSRNTIYFNQFIDADNLNDENENSVTPKQEVDSSDNLKSRKINVLNDPIIVSSPVNEYKNSDGVNDALRNTKARHTINFNQPIIAEALDQAKERGAIPKIKFRPTSNNNQSIELSPIKTKSDLPRQTINCYEDIPLSPQKPSKECVAGNKLIISESSLKKGQQPKLVVRKIYTPQINKTTNQIDVEKHKLMRYKKKQEENSEHNVSMNETAGTVETTPIKEKSLNFSMSSVKNTSLSPDSLSSFLIPSEFKAYNFKQLNDEIEKGKIHVFSNILKISGTDRKLRTPSQFSTDNIQSFQTYAKHRTFVFQNEDILVTSNDSLKKDVIGEKSEKKNNGRCRYSQADEIMLDNTSFLAKAKLSDETVSRNSSRKERTQLDDFLDLSNESLGKAAIESNIILEKNNLENEAACSMANSSKEFKPQHRQAITSSDYIKPFGIDNMNVLIENRFLQNNVHFQNAIPNTELIYSNDFDTKYEEQSEKNNIFEMVNNERRTISSHDDVKELIENEDFCSVKQTLHANAYLDPDNSVKKNDKVRDISPLNDIDKLTKQTSFSVSKKNINEVDLGRYTRSYENNYMDKTMNAQDDLIQVKCENNNKMVSDDFNCQNILESLVENSKNPRKTTYYDNCIINDENIIVVNGENISANVEMVQDQIKLTRNPDIDLNITENLQEKTSLKSFGNNEADISESNFFELCESGVKEIHETENVVCEPQSRGRKTVYVEESMNLTVDNIETEKEDDIKQLQIDIQHADIQHLKYTKPSRIIYTNGCQDLRQKENLNNLEKQINSGIKNKDNLQSDKSECVNNCDIDLISDKIPSTEKYISTLAGCDNGEDMPNVSNKFLISNNKEIRKTMLFKENNDMSIDSPIEPVDNIEYSEPAKQLKSTKILEGNKSTISMASKLKYVLNKQHNCLVTPIKSGTFNQLCYITPRLSLIEFTAAEKRAKKEELLQNTRCFSPKLNESLNKRLSLDLTPLQSISKKRQTLIFDDCLMDESNDNIEVDDINEEKIQIQETLSFSEHNVTGHVIEISGICSNESLLQTPSIQRHSQIPNPVSSEKEDLRYESQLNTKDDCFKEAEEEHNLEGDNFAESIQLMRKTKTERPNNVAEKRSVFESNPITISDVSIFFEAQRKNKSFIPQIKEGLPTEKHNMRNVNVIEVEKNDLENRYINLTLDDIDKTRLSLVRASYVDEDDNQSSNKCFVIDDQSQMNQTGNVRGDGKYKNFDGKCRSTNYLRNSSFVCRKCKRCQETFLNESTSSTSDSFVLPSLPPLPDLGLDHLKRLRKRPTISDVNILFQRLSLDGKIMNTTNVSDDSRLFSRMEDENAPATKCIRKYEIDMQTFERELLDKKLLEPCFKQLPFVVRLNDLLRTYSSNWIFDFQKQYRGILSFTHRRMLTFAVLLTFEEVDVLGSSIKLRDIKLVKGHVPENCWKAIDFVLDFQFKLNLPYDLKSLCECSTETSILNMLQTIDRFCIDTVRMGICLQRICFANQASILRDGYRTYVCKVVREIVNRNDAVLYQSVDKTVIKIELLNLKNLSFKDICSPKLHNFREEIHLLPVGLEFLSEFLPNPLKYLKHL